MGGRVVQLSGEAGINRLKVKGGPPKNALYDLVNGYIDATGCAVSRPGTTEAYALPAGTKGLCAFGGGLVVFSHQVVSGLPSGVTCEVLLHPDDPADTLAEIHFAGPFLGYLYVVAEFASGDVYHYWLQRQGAWAAGTVYKLGQLVEPTTPNGLMYRATRVGDPNPLWQPSVLRTVGDKIEPTVADGYYYECTDTQGSNPRSGTTEPDWNDSEDAVTYEDTDLGTTAVTPPVGPVTPPYTPGDDVTDRYGNPGGSRDYQSER